MRHSVCLVAAIAALTTTACSSHSVFKPSGPPPEFTVGVPLDAPGMGFVTNAGVHTGFDVEVARYVATHLGATPDHVHFVQTVGNDRDAFLANGKVDFVVSSYPMTDETKQKVGLAGPYFQAGQSLLVRTNNYDVKAPQSLNGRHLCAVQGSGYATRVRDQFAPDVLVEPRNTLADCVNALKKGQADAVTADNIQLAGFAADAPTDVKVVGQPFFPVPYGVALPKDKTKLRAQIDDILERMTKDGSAARFYEITVGASGYPMPKQPALDRY